ncbi:MAG: hypothetical protein KBT72_09545 [Zhongshania sp.]|nr:hypothetical protein [Zhongshania sp.]
MRSNTSELFISNLNVLNRKERYYLLLQVMGENAFVPTKQFVGSLRNQFAQPAINCDNFRFAAMDYHLDWIYAAFHATISHIDLKNDNLNELHPIAKNKNLVSGTQQDIDFIMAFSDRQSDIIHLVLIEAKGVGSWDIEQLKAKGARLRALFETHQLHEKLNVVPHFLYVSPKAPTENQLKSDLPQLMSSPANHIPMWLPTPLAKVTRCSKNGEPKAEGEFWKFE